ncbi:MAG: sulfatase-like hydrolase/transferase [Actinomycetota bacterium]|nr:sulfatase-like hydrolase/transferase [Actinomycetota bacterium]
MTGRPNILWLFSDQHRADTIGAAGHPVVRTSNLDSLIASAFTFERTFCQGPLCVPARVSLLTERYVRDHGAFENDYPARTDLPTMVQAIRAAGYHTAAIGKMHLFPHPPDVALGLPLMTRFGFDEVVEAVGKLASGFVRNAYTDHLERHGLLEQYQAFVRPRVPWRRNSLPVWTVDPSPLPAEHHIDWWVGEKAVEWIESRPAGQPFFCWVGFPGPHDPWDAPASYVRQYEDADIPLDSTRRPDVPGSGPLAAFLNTFLDYSSSSTLTDGRTREVRRHYYANVTLIDEAIGRILAALDRSGLADDTWVVYSTDHGEMLGTHGLLNKMVFYEPAVRVPLVIRPPKGSVPVRLEQMVEHVDLAATLGALAGAAPVEGSAGVSFADALVGRPPGGSDWAGREAVVSENYGFAMWRTERYKLVVYGKTRTPVQLFDLMDDPEEDVNRVDDPAYAPVVSDLRDGFVEPFLSVPPRRPGPDLVERGGGIDQMHRSVAVPTPAD